MKKNKQSFNASKIAAAWWQKPSNEDHFGCGKHAGCLVAGSSASSSDHIEAAVSGLIAAFCAVVAFGGSISLPLGFVAEDVQAHSPSI